MNILPLVLLLILVLSALGVKQVENFKNHSIVQKEYREFIELREAEDVNSSQRKLYDSNDYYKTRKLNFRPFFDKSKRLDDPESQKRFQQLTQVLKNLIKLLYGETNFFKKMEQKRPQFIDELINRIIFPSDQKNETILKGGIENLAQLNLGDAQLQELFYHMLKGTVEREEVEPTREVSPLHAEKTYPSLLDFLSDKMLVSHSSKFEMIPIYSAPRELLMAIYGNKEIALQIEAKQKEIRDSGLESAQKEAEFKRFGESLPKTEFDDILKF